MPRSIVLVDETEIIISSLQAVIGVKSDSVLERLLKLWNTI